MNFDFLHPVDPALIEELRVLHPSALAHKTAFHQKDIYPDLSDAAIAILGIRENRREVDADTDTFDFDKIRRKLYGLFPGNWPKKIVDLGDILPGATVEDTYYAVKETVNSLLHLDIIPVILGGSQDLTYVQYRAYDSFKKMLNLVNIDAYFDIGDPDGAITDRTYMGKIFVEEPHHLYDYANLGYQTYLNPPEEIELIDKLYFESYRLGEISADITLSEPVLRGADLVSLDINVLADGVSKTTKESPNGFNGREICALARYAGISDRVSSFGIYNLHHLNPRLGSSMLPAQIIWYFIEGVNYRKNEQYILKSNDFIKYKVPLDDDVLTFYKSKRSDRWWIEIPVFVDNKPQETTFLPCSHQDYLEACNQQIPERWYRARRKNEL